MNNCKKYALVAVMAAAAGFAYIKSSRRNIPADFRDAVGGEFDLGKIKASDIKTLDEVPASAPAAVMAKEHSGGDIVAVKKADFPDYGVMYPLRDCLAVGNNSTVFDGGPACAESLTARAAKVKDYVLQAAVGMKRLDDYTDTYYINPGISLMHMSPLGLARHLGGSLFKKNLVERGKVCELLGINGSCDVWAAGDVGKPAPGAEMRSVVSVTGFRDATRLHGTILKSVGSYASLDESTMVYDPRKGGISAVGYEALQSLYVHLLFGGDSGSAKYRYVFERDVDSLGNEVEIFRAATETMYNGFFEERVRVGDIIEHVRLNPDGSLDYVYGVYGLAGKDQREHEIAVKIKNSRIVPINLEGLAGMAQIEAEQERVGKKAGHEAEVWLRESTERWREQNAKRDEERAREARKIKEANEKWNSPEESRKRMERLLEKNNAMLKKLEEKSLDPHGFTEHFAAALYGEDHVRDVKRRGGKISW